MDEGTRNQKMVTPKTPKTPIGTGAGMCVLGLCLVIAAAIVSRPAWEDVTGPPATTSNIGRYALHKGRRADINYIMKLDTVTGVAYCLFDSSLPGVRWDWYRIGSD